MNKFFQEFNFTTWGFLNFKICQSSNFYVYNNFSYFNLFRVWERQNFHLQILSSSRVREACWQQYDVSCWTMTALIMSTMLPLWMYCRMPNIKLNLLVRLNLWRTVLLNYPAICNCIYISIMISIRTQGWTTCQVLLLTCSYVKAQGKKSK